MDQAAAQYQNPYYNQPQQTQQYVHAEPLPQQQSFVAPGEGEVWNISQNKASYVVSIAELVAAPEWVETWKDFIVAFYLISCWLELIKDLRHQHLHFPDPFIQNHCFFVFNAP